jgi:ribulose-phosphate 3-epimerase
MSEHRWTGKLPPIRIAPSMVASDLAHLADQVAMLEDAGISMFHIDVADAHFAPNIMLGPRFVEVLRPLTDGHLNVHLMMTDPARYAPAFIKAGADLIFFHIEAVPEPREIIDLLREADCATAVALKPDTPAESLAGCIDEMDAVMVMTVNPGFSGQSFIETACRKIPAVRRMKPGIDVYVDGGVGVETAPVVVGYGANVLVVGSALFKPGVDTADAVQEILASAARGAAAH